MDKSKIRVGDILRADWSSGIYKLRCLELIPSDPKVIYAEVLEPPQDQRYCKTFATLDTLSPWPGSCPMEVKL